MKSVRTVGNRLVDVVDVAVRPPAKGEVLVKVAVSAICGSEMRAYRGDGHAAGGNGGHEAAGVVVEVGAGVTGIAVGDRVGLSAIVGCGHCEECAAGRYTWCTNRAFVSGMHAEFVTIAARACHVLPDDIDWATGVLISGDGLGVPFHTLTKFPDDADSVAVFGLGPIGLGAVLLHSYLGRRVIGVDISASRLDLARSLGATYLVDASDGASVVPAVRALTGDRGPDVCIEAAGSPITARAAFDSVRTGGTVLFNGEQGALELSPSEDFIRRDITASGTWFYHFSEYGPMLELARGGLPVARLVTHTFAVDDASDAFTAMDRGETGKVLLEYAA